LPPQSEQKSQSTNAVWGNKQIQLIMQVAPARKVFPYILCGSAVLCGNALPQSWSYDG